jgi:AmiR/NasT family two-component response regulator
MDDAKEPQAEVIARLTDKVEGLQEALLSRDVIGQAKGILMERLHLTSDQAFEQLRIASQQVNVKLRDLATRVAETGQWPIELDNKSSNGHHRPAPS